VVVRANVGLLRRQGRLGPDGEPPRASSAQALCQTGGSHRQDGKAGHRRGPGSGNRRRLRPRLACDLVIALMTPASA